MEIRVWHCLALLLVLFVVMFFQHLTGRSYLWEDFLYYNYPVRSFAATSMASGEMPLWNPYTFNGMPFLADIQTAVFYLPLTSLALAVSDGVLHPYWLQLVILLHYPLAGFGMFYLAKSFRLGQVPSFVSAAAFMLSGFMIVHAIHQQIITLVAWYPLAFLLFRRAITEVEWKWVFLGGLVLGLSVLAGYPQLSLYFYVLLLAYFLFELFGGGALVSRPSTIMSARAALVVLISVGVAMVQLLPTFELSGLSQRAEITYEKATEGSLSWLQMVTLMVPRVFGFAGAKGYEYFGPGTYWYYWETCIYLGVIPLILTVLALRERRKDRMKTFLVGVAIFALLYALGKNFLLHGLFFDFVPGFSTFRNPARIGIILTFAVSLLAGFGMQAVGAPHSPVEKLRARNVLLFIGGVSALLWLSSLAGFLPSLLDAPPGEQVQSTVKRETGVWLFITLVSAGAVYYSLTKGLQHRAVLLIIAGVFLLDVYLFGHDQNSSPTNPLDYFGRSAQLVDYFKKEGGIFRINTRNSQGMIMDRNQGMVSRIQTMEGYTPLALQRFIPPVGSDERLFDLLNVRYKAFTDTAARGLRIVPHENPLPRAFMVYEVRVLKDSTALVDFIKGPVFRHRSMAVVEKELHRTLQTPSETPEWTTSVVDYRNNSVAIKVQTSHDGFLVLSEVFYPGWIATVDGAETEIYRTNFNLRGIQVPRGDHSVVVRFEPETYTTGGTITLIVLAVSCGGIVLGLRRGKNSGNKMETPA